jgi:hypothetical protein
MVSCELQLAEGNSSEEFGMFIESTVEIRLLVRMNTVFIFYHVGFIGKTKFVSSLSN